MVSAGSPRSMGRGLPLSVGVAARPRSPGTFLPAAAFAASCYGLTSCLPGTPAYRQSTMLMETMYRNRRDVSRYTFVGR